MVLQYTGQDITTPAIMYIYSDDELLRDPDATTKKTGIHIAVVTQDVAKVKEIVSNHPDALKEVDHRGESVLHKATAANTYLEMMETLINLGADIHARCHSKYTPLDNAVYDGSDKIVDILLKHGAPIDGYKDNVSPIMSAAMCGNTAVVKLLLEKAWILIQSIAMGIPRSNMRLPETAAGRSSTSSRTGQIYPCTKTPRQAT